MNTYTSMFTAVIVISVIGDISHVIHSLGATPGSEISRNSFSLISGADAGLLSSIAKAVSRYASRQSVKKSAAGHTKNKRPSNKNKHQKGDARRDKDKKNSDGQKGSKGGSKTRPNKNKG